jgi:Peptidase A4 family
LSRCRAVTAAALLGLTTVLTPVTGLAVASAQGHGAPAVGVVHSVRGGWRSSNWSGYAIAGSGFTSITGNWTVPQVKHASPTRYSAAWIGIDGFNNSKLIQTGTEEDSNGVYRAWWEILPAPETPVFSVSPGDHMQASVTKGGSGWTITITDTTAGRSFSIVKNYNGPGTSAEWIVEAPTVGGGQAVMANYGRITLDPGTVNGGNPNLTSSESGVMVNGAGKVVSTPSVPDSDTDGFNMAYGSKAPPPPGS